MEREDIAKKLAEMQAIFQRQMDEAKAKADAEAAAQTKLFQEMIARVSGHVAAGAAAAGGVAAGAGGTDGVGALGAAADARKVIKAAEGPLAGAGGSIVEGDDAGEELAEDVANDGKQDSSGSEREDRGGKGRKSVGGKGRKSVGGKGAKCISGVGRKGAGGSGKSSDADSEVQDSESEHEDKGDKGRKSVGGKGRKSVGGKGRKSLGGVGGNGLGGRGKNGEQDSDEQENSESEREERGDKGKTTASKGVGSSSKTTASKAMGGHSKIVDKYFSEDDNLEGGHKDKRKGDMYAEEEGGGSPGSQGPGMQATDTNAQLTVVSEFNPPEDDGLWFCKECNWYFEPGSTQPANIAVHMRRHHSKVLPKDAESQKKKKKRKFQQVESQARRVIGEALASLARGNAVSEDGDAQLDAVAQLKKEKEKNAALTARVKALEAVALKDAQTKAKYASLAQQMLALAGFKSGSKKGGLTQKAKLSGAYTKATGKRTLDERVAASKHFKPSETGEGGSSSGRVKRKARLNCTNDLCKLLDEDPISVMAQHCGHPHCMRSENRIAELFEMENLKNEFEAEKLKHQRGGK